MSKTRLRISGLEIRAETTDDAHEHHEERIMARSGRGGDRKVRSAVRKKTAAAPADGDAAGAVPKVLRILALFASGPTRATTEEIALATGLPRSSTYRYTALLREAGFLTQDRAGCLEVAPLAVGLARTARAAGRLVSTARPFMQRLTQASRELTLLAKRSGNLAVCIEMCESVMQIRYTFELGTTFPLHQGGAMRRLLLAFAPESQQEQIIARAMQEGSSYPLATLQQELQTIRERGYAESEAEITPDLWGVAAPIFRGTMTDTALVLLAPAYRVNRVERARLRSAVRTAAREISDDISFDLV